MKVVLAADRGDGLGARDATQEELKVHLAISTVIRFAYDATQEELKGARRFAPQPPTLEEDATQEELKGEGHYECSVEGAQAMQLRKN